MNFSVGPGFQCLPLLLTDPMTSIKLNPASSIAYCPSTSAASHWETKYLINTKLQAREPYIMNMPHSSCSKPDRPKYVSHSTKIKK